MTLKLVRIGNYALGKIGSRLQHYQGHRLPRNRTDSATLFGAIYPQQNFDEAWKKILFNQFHDILPGSGIHINYVDAARKYAETERVNRDIIHRALSDLASRVNSPGTGLIVFNPLSWTRTDEVEADVQFPGPFNGLSAVDPDGKQVLLEIVHLDRQTNRATLRLLAENVPAMGYKLIRFEAIAKPVPNSKRPVLEATADSLENDFMRLKVDPKTGCITSLLEKRGNREALALPVQSEGSPAASPDGLPCGADRGDTGGIDPTIFRDSRCWTRYRSSHSSGKSPPVTLLV